MKPPAVHLKPSNLALSKSGKGKDVLVLPDLQVWPSRWANRPTLRLFTALVFVLSIP